MSRDFWTVEYVQSLNLLMRPLSELFLFNASRQVFFDPVSDPPPPHESRPLLNEVPRYAVFGRLWAIA